MANKEACEIYIEEQIQEGLEKGKTPYSLGKEISDWISKFLEVNIKPRTIEQRARRKNATNVAKNSNTVTKPTSYEPQEDSITHPPTNRGGKRENAGRPKSEEWESRILMLQNTLHEVEMCVDRLAKLKEYKKRKGEVVSMIQELTYYAQERKQDG